VNGSVSTDKWPLQTGAAKRNIALYIRHGKIVGPVEPTCRHPGMRGGRPQARAEGECPDRGSGHCQAAPDSGFVNIWPTTTARAEGLKVAACGCHFAARSLIYTDRPPDRTFSKETDLL
jgi:hypothetical protein